MSELGLIEQKRAAVDAALRAYDLARFNVVNVASWLVSALDFQREAEGEQDPEERQIKARVARAEVERELSRLREKLAAVEAANRAVSAALEEQP
jgi:hypothetical protein